MARTVEKLDPHHPDWPCFLAVLDEVEQKDAVSNTHFMPFPRHFLAARLDGKIVGGLFFVVWEIGPHDRRQPTIEADGVALTEAKIIAFGVKKAYRRRGVGRALQEETIRKARDLGCYQVRSVSQYARSENHRLKLAMGFAVEPMERETPSVAFVMPLRAVDGAEQKG